MLNSLFTLPDWFTREQNKRKKCKVIIYGFLDSKYKCKKYSHVSISVMSILTHTFTVVDCQITIKYCIFSRLVNSFRNSVLLYLLIIINRWMTVFFHEVSFESIWKYPKPIIWTWITTFEILGRNVNNANDILSRYVFFTLFSEARMKK